MRDLTPADSEFNIINRISSRGSVPVAIEEPEIAPTPLDASNRVDDFRLLLESPGPRLLRVPGNRRLFYDAEDPAAALTNIASPSPRNATGRRRSYSSWPSPRNELVRQSSSASSYPRNGSSPSPRSRVPNRNRPSTQNTNVRRRSHQVSMERQTSSRQSPSHCSDVSLGDEVLSPTSTSPTP